ncbi:AI-2E family transporter [bacterium]|nr:MAG: AI-2E family transporter [bacterium]
MANGRPSTVTIQVSWKTILAILGLILGIWVVYMVGDFLILLFASIVVAAALAPYVRKLERKGLPRWAATTAIYLTIFLVLGLILVLVVPTITKQVADLVRDWPNINSSLQATISQNETLRGLYSSLTQGPANGSGSLVSQVVNITSVFVNGVATTVLFFVLTFYILMNGRKIAHFMIGLVPAGRDRERYGRLVTKMSERMGFWFRGQFIISTMTFLVVWAVLSLLHVEYALTLALIAGVAEFIPLVGSWVGGAPAVIVAFGQSPVLALFVIIFFFAWQSFQGYIISPQVMRRAIGVPSIFILISVLILAKLIGFVGVFLAAPIAAAVAVLVEEYADGVHSQLKKGFAARTGQRRG